uniref:PAX-interacting protein 1 n=1 Tax=Acrobeloides nanus TaxID=290746 RepID=A0A914CNJ2_9BILA
MEDSNQSTTNRSETPSNMDMELNQVSSPLGTLDPHRLRDMVVDKQAVASQLDSNSLNSNWSPANLPMTMSSPISESSPSLSNQRQSAGNDSSLTFATPQLQQIPSSQPMFKSGGYPGQTHEPTQFPPPSPSRQMSSNINMMSQNPMDSPLHQQMHPSQSPFPTSSGTSPSSFPQQQMGSIQYPGPNQPSHITPPHHMAASQIPQSPSTPGYPQSQMQRIPYPGGAAAQTPYPYSNWMPGQQQSMPQQYMAQSRLMGPNMNQRPIMQRIPYPGYPQGTTQSQMIYPVQQRGGPRPQYPQSVPVQNATQPSNSQNTQLAQTGVVGQHQNYYPTPGGYPPGYPPTQQGAGAQFHSVQMAYQQRAQTQQPGIRMPFMGSTSGSQGSPLVQPAQPHMYPTGAQTPHSQASQTPTPGYSQTTPRYPTPQTVSPHYSSPAQDMRSPPIISPTQAAQLPHQQQIRMQQHHQQIEMARQVNAPQMPPQHLRMSQGSTFYGHDLQAASSISPLVCLAGCCFLISEEFPVDRHSLTSVIRYYGGEVELWADNHTNNSPRPYSERVTHILVETVNCPLITKVYNQVSKFGDYRRRLITLQWLNDVLLKKQMVPPWKACHLPTTWCDANRPAVGKVIAISGFDEQETSNLKSMILAIGASYTSYLTKHNHILIAKNLHGEKVEKAKDGGMHIVNYLWLQDLYLGIRQPILDIDNARYAFLEMMQPAEVSLSPNQLEKLGSFASRLMVAWQWPIAINEEILARATEIHRNVENDETVFPYKKFKLQDDAPNDEQIHAAIELLKSKDISSDVVVYFSGLLPEQVDNLSRKVRLYGAHVSESVSECSHFVVPSLERTIPLIEAIAQGKSIVSPNWILQSYAQLKLIDELEFFVRDSENERKYGFNLKNTIKRARHRKVFENITFHVSRGVQPAYDIICNLIIDAGGKVDRSLPTRKKLARCIQTEDTYFLIVNENDLHLYEYLTMYNFPLFNEEFVFMGILRHSIDVSQLYRVNSPHLAALQAQVVPRAPSAVNTAAMAKQQVMQMRQEMLPQTVPRVKA